MGIRRSPKKLKHWSPATLVQGRGSPSKTRYSPQVFVSDFVAVGQAVSAYRHVGSQFFFFWGGEVWGPALLGWGVADQRYTLVPTSHQISPNRLGVGRGPRKFFGTLGTRLLGMWAWLTPRNMLLRTYITTLNSVILSQTKRA